MPIEGGKQEERRQPAPPDLRHWQIEEFLRQTGKSDNTQRVYRRQLVRFAAWCDKSWLDVTPSDIGKYRRELKSIEQSHRGIKQRYYPTLGFGAIESAKRFCQAFDEVKQFLRPRAKMTELVSPSKQREHFIERVNELQNLFQAIEK